MAKVLVHNIENFMTHSPVLIMSLALVVTKNYMNHWKKELRTERNKRKTI